MNKDWIGNSKSTFTSLGASNHSNYERVSNDYYATDPKALELLLDEFMFHKNIYECACGEGNLSKVLLERGYNVYSTDLIDRGYGRGGIDFLKTTELPMPHMDIITNPPYKYAKEFVEHSLDLIEEDYYVAMFLKLTFLESKGRRKLFDENPPEWIVVSSNRIGCYRNNDMSSYSAGAIAYAWFIWKKGYKDYPKIIWFN